MAPDSTSEPQVELYSVTAADGSTFAVCRRVDLKAHDPPRDVALVDWVETLRTKLISEG